MSFAALGLSEPIVRAVTSEGYSTPTPIQAQAIPEILAGRDLLGCAQTGTGKTCAFALPILQRLAEAGADAKSGRNAQGGRPPRALILCPTRELASQISESFCAYGRNLPLRHTVIFGGVSQWNQVRALRAGVDIVVATPGRLLDLLNQNLIDLRSVETLVLDEADRMLDMGFIVDIRRIVSILPETRQTLLFSATVSPEIRKLSESILRSPVHVQTARESTTADAIDQRVYMVDRQRKAMLLGNLLRDSSVGRALVFTRTKHGADKLVKILRNSDINADAIHGNKTQNARTRTMQSFRSGRTPILVATDIASRGIDVDDITHVVNFDMPIDAETYVHRIGRTARAGATGIALSLCDRDEVKILRAIERRTRVKIEVMLPDREQTPQHQPQTQHQSQPRPRAVEEAPASVEDTQRRPREQDTGHTQPQRKAHAPDSRRRETKPQKTEPRAAARPQRVKRADLGMTPRDGASSGDQGRTHPNRGGPRTDQPRRPARNSRGGKPGAGARRPARG